MPFILNQGPRTRRVYKSFIPLHSTAGFSLLDSLYKNFISSLLIVTVGSKEISLEQPINNNNIKIYFIIILN